MTQIQQTGSYRSKRIEDLGVGKTKNGYPQLILSLRAEEVWDEDEHVWVNCSEADSIGQEITGYLVLVGGNDNVIFHHKQVMKVFEWDGMSFARLANADPSAVAIQWRVEENLNPETNVVNLKVAGIDIYDAEPGKLVQKLTSEEIADLDTKYGNVLRKAVQGNKPVKPVGKPNLPWLTAKSPKDIPVVTTTEHNTVVTTSTQAPGTITPKIETSKESKPPKKTTKVKTAAVKKGCTQQEAWDACQAMKSEETTDEELANMWIDAVSKTAPGGEEENMNDELWEQVRITVTTLLVETGLAF